MIRIVVALGLSMAVQGGAWAATCPWAGVESLHVRASMAQVWINDLPYEVRGLQARTWFEETLVACGANDAALAFTRWRAKRRGTNVLVGIGIVYWPVLIGVPFMEVSAREFKLQMIDALQPTYLATPADTIARTPVPVPPHLVASGATHFREAAWGMSMDQIRALEVARFHAEDDDRIFFEGQVLGLRTMLMYEFARDRLIAGKYVVMDDHAGADDHIGDYLRLEEALTKKYGDPAVSEELWRDDTRRQTPSEWDHAVAAGELVLFARWDTPQTEIVLALMGENDEITLAIEYHSRD